MASLNKIRRSGKFKKLGAALSAFKPHYDDRDYYTGKESSFRFGRSDKQNRDDQEVEGKGVEIGFGPQFKTPQWDRTIRN